MTDSVLLFIRAGIFMFFDHVVVVVIDGRAGNDTGLGPAAHCLGVKIITGHPVLDEACAHDPVLQEFSGSAVDALIVDVNILWKGGLRPVDRQK